MNNDDMMKAAGDVVDSVIEFDMDKHVVRVNDNIVSIVEEIIRVWLLQTPVFRKNTCYWLY